LFDHLQTFVKTKEEDLKEHSPDLFQVTQKLLITDDQNQLLILKAVIGDFYDLPGGRLNLQEFNVSLPQCLEREVVEELGTEVKLEIEYQPVAVEPGVLWDKHLQTDHYRRIFILGYKAKYLGGEIKLSDEHEFYKWVDIDCFDPRGLFRPGHEQVVEEFLHQQRTAQ